jgi:hypothetical protein
MKQLELSDFLRDLHIQFHNKIAALRIRKSCYNRLHLLEKETIELMESEIRSFFYRYQRLSNIFFTFGKSL